MSRLDRYLAAGKRAARAGLEAHVRLTLARQLRSAAKDCRLLGLEAMAADLRRKARTLDAQRYRIMGKAKR